MKDLLKLLNPKAEIVSGTKQVYTDMAISAHHDDIELMCPQGIIKGYQSSDFGLVGVVCSDGAGSPRAGLFADMTNEEMKAVRRKEQIEAAKIGDYSSLVMLGFPSGQIKDEKSTLLTEDIFELLVYYKPEIVYIHNLADKHATHVKVAMRSIDALRMLPEGLRPQKVYGCEVWRTLDWLPDSEKILFDLSGYEELLNKVLSVHRSQIAGGKRYDLAAEGRRLANATFSQSHKVDKSSSSAVAMDLTPLIIQPQLDIKEFVLSAVERFKKEVFAILQ